MIYREPGYTNICLEYGAFLHSRLSALERLRRHIGAWRMASSAAQPAGCPRSLRRKRTIFTDQQLSTLEYEFRKTRHPGANTRERLASTLGLDQNVVNIWFKNRRVKWRKEEREAQCQLSQRRPSEEAPGTGQETLLPINPGESSRMRAGHLYAHDPGQPGEALGFVDNSSGHQQAHEVNPITLGTTKPPWADFPYDIEAFVELYALPGDDDPSCMDQYLNACSMHTEFLRQIQLP